MKAKALLACIILFFISATTLAAESLSLYIIYPDGEGDSEAAKPYLVELYDYLTEETGRPMTGDYLNDEDDALEALNTKKIELAIVSPDFFERHQKKYSLKKELNTIPSYSSGPFEKYYIMANQKTEVLDLMEGGLESPLYSSKKYDSAFVNDKVFAQNEDIKKINWRLTEVVNIVDIIKKIAQGDTQSFVLLSGYEFSVVNKLQKTNKNFSSLKLIFSSKELPSSPLVSVGGNAPAHLNKTKEALLKMQTSLRGNIILKKLRLKGFAGL